MPIFPKIYGRLWPERTAGAWRGWEAQKTGGVALINFAVNEHCKYNDGYTRVVLVFSEFSI